jgi:FkbM family methyltransferase
LNGREDCARGNQRVLDSTLRRASTEGADLIPQVSQDKETDAVKGLSFSRFAWALARTLRVLGRVWARSITETIPPSPYVQRLIGRVLHLNEVLGYFLPSLTYVLSSKTLDRDRIVFRPFTDDVDKVSESYEPMVRKLLSPLTSEVVVDIGANIGIHSIWLSRLVGPSGQVIAVEPEPNNFLILRLNQHVNGIRNIVTIRTALSSKRTTGKLTVPRATLMGQASTHTASLSSKSYVISVDFDTLDNIISARQLSAVSTIKIDVEGAEISVLQGAKKTIERFAPRLVIEVHGEDNMRSIRDFLKSLNMTIVSETISTSRPDESRRFILAVRNATEATQS